RRCARIHRALEKLLRSQTEPTHRLTLEPNAIRGLLTPVPEQRDRRESIEQLSVRLGRPMQRQ
ncbi:MAG: hypothetical protein AAFQ16_06810, partial [Pseudomonadota bacterium]